MADSVGDPQAYGSLYSYAVGNCCTDHLADSLPKVDLETALVLDPLYRVRGRWEYADRTKVEVEFACGGEEELGIHLDPDESRGRSFLFRAQAAMEAL